jgi:hypothetical protein
MPRIYATIVMFLLLSEVVLMTQPQLSIQPAPLTTTIPNAQISVEQIEEHIRKLPNGKSQKNILVSTIYRDAAGRVRMETKYKAALIWHRLPVSLCDPVAGFNAFLEPRSRVAQRLIWPKSYLTYGFGSTRPGIMMGGKNVVMERLGKKMILGAEFEGMRMRATSEDDPTRISIDERWVSSELGLTALVEASSPSEHYIAKVLSMNHNSPDSNLFIIPSDYTIEDDKIPDNLVKLKEE